MVFNPKGRPDINLLLSVKTGAPGPRARGSERGRTQRDGLPYVVSRCRLSSIRHSHF